MRVSSKKNTKDIEVGKSGVIPTILNADLIDASGSMADGHKYDNAMAGLNYELETLKGDKNANYKVFITEFDSDIAGRGEEQVRYGTEIEGVPLEKMEVYKGRGPLGFTPLYQAIGYMIHKLLKIKKPEDRVLLKILTDGMENASRGEYEDSTKGRNALYNLIEKVKKENKFTVTFVGTPQDTETIIKNLGIDRGNTMTHDNTAKGVRASYKMSAVSTMAFSEDVKERGINTSDSFFSKSVEENQ